MEDIRVFRPVPASTVSLSATTSSSRVEVLTTSVIQNTNGTHIVRLYNAGSVVVFVNFGTVAVTAATTTGMPIAPGSVEAFHVHPTESYVSGITASGTATLYATPGVGA